MARSADRIQAPSAARRPTGLEGPGDVRSDDFYWLRERNNPEVIDYLEAENTYTAAIMQPGETLQQTLYAEMRV